MSSYTSMKPFRDNLELVKNKYLFPGVESSSNYQVLSVMSNYISSYNYIYIFFDLFIYIILK